MDWLKKLKEYAPDIAMAVASGGATLPALAVKAVRDAVGDPKIDNESALASFIEQANPDAMLKVTQANNSFKIRMRELDNELEMAELKNQEQARDAHKQSRMPGLITLLMTAIMGYLIHVLMITAVPESNEEILYLLTGQASALWAASITYWVGTTRSSSLKTVMMNLRGGK